MDKGNLKNNLVFINKETIRNVDLINLNDRFISYGEGEIKRNGDYSFVIPSGEIGSSIRVNERVIKYPLLVGEYFYYKISLEELRKTEIHLHKALSFLDMDDSVDDFLSLIYEDNKFYENLLKFNKLILISYLVASDEMRKNDIIFSEFIKTFHKQHYSDDVMVLGYFKPIQYNKYFNEFVIKNEKIEIKEKAKSLPKFIPSEKFYNPQSISKSNDYEYDCLKVYSLAIKHGFKEINKDKYLFQYLPKNI